MRSARAATRTSSVASSRSRRTCSTRGSSARRAPARPSVAVSSVVDPGHVRTTGGRQGGRELPRRGPVVGRGAVQRLERDHRGHGPLGRLPLGGQGFDRRRRRGQGDLPVEQGDPPALAVRRGPRDLGRATRGLPPRGGGREIRGGGGRGPPGRRGERRRPGVVDGRRHGHSGLLGDAGHEVLDLLLVDGALLAGGPAAFDQPAFDGLEPVGAEQPLEQRGPLGGRRLQEPRELPLRQQHDLEELRRGHAEQPEQFVVGLAVAGADRRPHRAAPLLQRHGRRRLGGAGAGAPGPPLLGRAGDPQAPTHGGELERDLGADVVAGVVAAQVPGRHPGAGHGAVEGVADRVEQRGLAGAGVAVEQEQPGGAEGVEVDLDATGERAEGLDRQLVRTHVRPPRRRRDGPPRTPRRTACTRRGPPRSAGRARRSRPPPPDRTGAAAGRRSRGRRPDGPPAPTRR